MPNPRWEDVREDWDSDEGTLRDLFVSAVTTEDWHRIRALVEARRWPSSYSEDGRAVPMPSTVQDIVDRRHDHNVLWQIWPVAEVAIHCQFWFADEMEFDVAVAEIRGQEQFDAVCDFVSSVGRELQKPVAITIESAHDEPIMWYEPASDEFRRMPP